MSNTDFNTEEQWNKWETRQKRGKIMGGLLIAVIGGLFLARELGAALPQWLFTWKMFLIGLGVVFAVKHKFRHPAWIILMSIGGVFLFNDFYPEIHLKPYLWPVVLIIIGLAIAFKPRRNKNFKKSWMHWQGKHQGRYEECRPGSSVNQPGSNEDDIESTVIMAGAKRNIISKQFKGGEVTNIFGGTEINLLQADLAENAKLEITQVMGGTLLLIPVNWEIRSELTTIMGSVEDKRMMPQEPTANKKVLVLTGTTVMGGIEIKSL